jgi:UDP-glucose 4-epimerase
VIAIFCGCIETGRRPTIFGDGRQTRDYVYVGDVAAANVAAAAADVRGQINVGTSIETSVLEIVSELAELAGVSDFAPTHAPARLGELARSCLAIGRAKELLGWEPRISLREGLRLTLEAERPQ